MNAPTNRAPFLSSALAAAFSTAFSVGAGEACGRRTVSSRHRRLPAFLALFLGVLAAGLLLAPAPPVLARTWEAGVDYGSETHFLVTRSSRFFDADNVVGGSNLRIGLTVADDLFVDLTWAQNSSRRDRGGAGESSYRARLSDDSYNLSMRMRWPSRSWLEPYARAGAGATRHDARIGTAAADVYRAVKWTPHVNAGVGVDLVLSREQLWRHHEEPRPRFTIGLTLELGWQHVFSADMEMVRAQPLDPELDASNLHLGRLAMSGLTTRLAAVLRF